MTLIPIDRNKAKKSYEVVFPIEYMGTIPSMFHDAREIMYAGGYHSEQPLVESSVVLTADKIAQVHEVDPKFGTASKIISFLLHPAMLGRYGTRDVQMSGIHCTENDTGTDGVTTYTVSAQFTGAILDTTFDELNKWLSKRNVAELTEPLGSLVLFTEVPQSMLALVCSELNDTFAATHPSIIIGELTSRIPDSTNNLRLR